MDSEALREGYLLKNEEYRIISLLGQGGFGITYLAEQLSLSRKVAIKEFFMKENCNRDENTSEVSVPSVGSRELVDKFRQKFLREARMIAKLDNPYIVKIHDVFEENGTAYYVMEYLGNGSLQDEVKWHGAMSESKALGYIGQVADALGYLHGKNILHFDVKPANILVGNAGQATLIDFGISKHYDTGGSQTSSTPVGISKGYAPLEQYQQGEISTFTPATDIYALGATLYYLLLGQIPPSASEVNEEGLGVLPAHLSISVRKAIEKAMSPRRKDRPQSVKEFLSLLENGSSVSLSASEADEETRVEPIAESSSPSPVSSPARRGKSRRVLLLVLCLLVVLAGIFAAFPFMARKGSLPPVVVGEPDSVATAAVPSPAVSPSSSFSSPSVQTGTLKVSSTPSGAAIWLDGKNTGKTTPEVLEELSAGKHMLTLKLSGYQDAGKSVTVASSRRSESNIVLTKVPEVVQTGILKVSSTPSGAAIWLDGKNTGKTTPEVLEELPIGKHTLTLKLSGYQDADKSVTVASSRRAESNIVLTKEPEVVQTGTLKVLTTPSGAAIWLDGKNTGKVTPGVLKCLVGDHDILLRHSDFKDVSRAINVVSDQCTELSLSLGDNEDVFLVVEEMPEFLEGSVNEWISNNLKYPYYAQENGIQGKVFVKFVVEKDGSITDVRIVRGVDASLDREALRVVKTMPKWKPGKQRGDAVRVSYTIPINFGLIGSNSKKKRKH